MEKTQKHDCRHDFPNPSQEGLVQFKPESRGLTLGCVNLDLSMNSKFLRFFYFPEVHTIIAPKNTTGFKMAIRLRNKISIKNVGINGNNKYFRPFKIGNTLTHPTHKSESNNSSEIVIMLIRVHIFSKSRMFTWMLLYICDSWDF